MLFRFHLGLQLNNPTDYKNSNKESTSNNLCFKGNCIKILNYTVLIFKEN